MESERPASPEQHLWSSILDSVSSSRAIPSKNVVILGEASSGKTTLANALLQKSSVLRETDGEKSAYDFAMGYEWADVKDEAEEDTLARLSVYTVPSSSPAHLALVPHFLPPKSALPNTLAMIVLDWTRPWTFVEQLETWIQWVEKWAKGDTSHDANVVRDEGRERLQSHLQHYTEPSSVSEEAPLPGGNALSATLLPLTQGALTHNVAGVPIIIVCTKADMIDQNQSATGLGLSVMKAKGGEWEERTDTIMQVLRTIALKYGAALFYTSTSQPVSLTQLRAYALHFLFMPPAPPPDTPPLKYLFPFRQKPNLLDRDRIAMPSGWDTWGKIGVLRDGFDCSKWSSAWEQDLEDGANSAGGANDLYKAIVGSENQDEGPDIPPLITTEPEQAFLGKHYETLSKDPARDPRQSFRQPTNTEGSTAGIVGPLGTSSFSGPAMEKILTQMEGEDVGARLARFQGAAPARRDTRPPAAGLGPPTANGVPGARPALTTNFSSMSGSVPPSPSPMQAAGGRSQHEVLQDFFQSLLRDRGTTSAAPPASRTAPNPTSSAPGEPNGTSEPTITVRSPVSAQAEVEPEAPESVNGNGTQDSAEDSQEA